MKRLAVFAIVVLSIAAGFAQDLPKIAVYAAGHENPNINKAVATSMLSAFVNSGRYRPADRSDEFMARIAAERGKQLDGALNYAQITTTAKLFGVDFVCVADITPALGSNMIAARVVNADSEGVAAMGETESPLKSLADLTGASQRIVAILLDAAARQRAEAAPEYRGDPTLPATAPPVTHVKGAGQGRSLRQWHTEYGSQTI